MADQKSERIILKAKKPNGFEESKGNFQEPKKADNEDDEDNDKENEDDKDLLLKDKKEKLQIRFIECLNSFNTNAIEECIEYLYCLPFDVIEHVLTKTSGIQNPNWNYAKAILEDYVKRKINTLEKIEIEQQNFTQKNKKDETDKEKLQRKKDALKEEIENETG